MVSNGEQSTETLPTFAQFREHIREMEYVYQIEKWFNECHHLDVFLSTKDIQFKKPTY